MCLKAQRAVMHLIWLSCSWAIWKERNTIIFNNKISSTHQLMEKFKLLSFWRLKANNAHLAFAMPFWLLGHWLMQFFVCWFFCRRSLLLNFDILFWNVLCLRKYFFFWILIYILFLSVQKKNTKWFQKFL